MARTLCKKIIICMILPLLSAACSDDRRDALKKAFESYPGKYAIVIVKKDFSLTVYGRDLEPVQTYRIGYGSNRDMMPKLYEGDDRTPEGAYTVNEILSMDAGKETASYKKLKMMNGIYFRASAGFHRYGRPGEDLGDNAYGPRFFGIDYPNSADRERYESGLKKGLVPEVRGKAAGIGYGIAIHGNNDEDSIGGLCSSGCIRMYNRDVVEMEKYITIDSPVLIFSK